MNNNPKISIIVPVYNVEQYLPRCIDSILNQSFADFELLLIDDGSKDKSGAICDEYADKDDRIRVFHKKNGGVSSARNVGLDNAKGEYVIFVDSDDYLKMNALQIANTIKDDLVVASYEVKGYRSSNMIHDSVRYTRKSECLDYLSKKLLESHTLHAPWAKFYNRYIIECNNIRFIESLKLGEDICFVFNYLSYCNTLRFTDKVIYCYEMETPRQYILSASEFINHIRNTIQAIKRVHLFNHNLIYTEGKLDDMIKVLFCNAFEEYIKKQNPKQVIKQLSYIKKCDCEFLPSGRIKHYLFMKVAMINAYFGTVIYYLMRLYKQFKIKYK